MSGGQVDRRQRVVFLDFGQNLHTRASRGQPGAGVDRRPHVERSAGRRGVASLRGSCKELCRAVVRGFQGAALPSTPTLDGCICDTQPFVVL